MELDHPLTAQIQATPLPQTETSYWNGIRLRSLDSPSHGAQLQRRLPSQEGPSEEPTKPLSASSHNFAILVL